MHKLETCIGKLRSWMRKNKLKLNDDKTEFIVFGTPSALKEVKPSSIQIGDHVTHLSSCVRNIGAYFNSTLKMNDQVQHVCKSAWYHLHQICKLQGYLTEDQLKTLIHAYVTPKLDTNYGLLCSAYKDLIAKLQFVHNAAAKVICGLRKFDNATPSYTIYIGSQLSNASSSKFSYSCIKLDQVRALSISRTYFFHIVHIIRASPFSYDHQMTLHFWIHLILISLHMEIGHSVMQALTTATICHKSFVNWIHCLVSRKN